MYNPQTFNEMNNENGKKCYIFGINQQEDEQDNNNSNISEENNNGEENAFFEESRIQMMGKKNLAGFADHAR